MKFASSSCVAAAFVIAALPCWAINKCTGKDGKVVYQDAPCQNTATGNEQVKTWGAGQAAPGARATTSVGTVPVEPNAKLDGPPDAAALLTLYRRWADAERLAASTARISLAGPVASMQAIQREAESAAVPACLADAKAALVDLTGKSTAAMLDFMRRKDLQPMVYTLVDRERLIGAFESRVTGASCQAPKAS